MKQGMVVKERRDIWAGFFGILAFLVGVGMIAWSFYLAYQLFLVPPNLAVSSGPNAPIEVNKTISALFGVLVKVLLLLVMAALGSMIASRGIKLYGSKFPLPHLPMPKKSGDTEDRGG